MNNSQRLWWEQAQSDHAVLLLLRRRDAAPCHLLHYLQMTTEKLGKAYFWRSGNSPPRSHAFFVRFLRALGGSKSSDRQRIADAFGFRRFEDFQNWIKKILPLAYDLEHLAPALAGADGPNPEYPWPSTDPQYAPATFEFDVWKQLAGSARGRQLLQVIKEAVEKFPVYG